MISRSSQSGQTLAELVVSTAILAVLAGAAIPALSTALTRSSLRAAASRVQLLLRLTKEEAMALGGKRGIRFKKEGDRWTWAVYSDGDGDGVLNADIASGADPLVRGPEDLGGFQVRATIGIPQGGVAHPDDGSWLAETAHPVRFNASSICSFNADGSSTPGTVYLRTVDGQAALVRTSGDGGLIRVLFYDRGSKKWTQP